MIKRLVREALAFKAQLDEVDWEDTFSDVKKTCVDPKDITDYLNKLVANADKEYGEREKFNKGTPYLHAKSSFFKDSKSGVVLNDFIEKITQKPNNLINTNEKILKSGGPHEFVYKTGLPALRGLAYDIKNKKFYYVNTCPGAGSCIAICYAMKGNYIRYAASYDSMTRRLNYLLNNPDEYEEQMYRELKAKAIEHKALKGYKPKVILRWNDSGDFFTKRYVSIAENVMKRLKEDGYNVDSYAYTKMGDVATDAKGFDTTFSVGANKKEMDKIDVGKQKLSKTVPKELFSDLDLMKTSDEEILKSRVAKHFKLNKDDVLTYDEMKSIPKTDIPKWSVIVTPEDGDDAAFRKDVKNVLLTIH
jgi:hypothetical protein